MKTVENVKTVKAASLVLDYDIYPRMTTDSKNVSDLTEALASGASLPPITVCSDSHRVIDGFHRVKAHMRFYGPEATIECVEKSYENEWGRISESASINSQHGCKLSTYDKSRCLLLAEKFDVSDEELSLTFGMSVRKIKKVRETRTASSAGGLIHPIKNTMSHLKGQHLSARQWQANSKLGGMNQRFYVDQVIELIEGDVLKKTDEPLMDRLRHLHLCLSTLFEA